MPLEEPLGCQTTAHTVLVGCPDNAWSTPHFRDNVPMHVPYSGSVGPPVASWFSQPAWAQVSVSHFLFPDLTALFPRAEARITGSQAKPSGSLWLPRFQSKSTCSAVGQLDRTGVSQDRGAEQEPIPSPRALQMGRHMIFVQASGFTIPS